MKKFTALALVAGLSAAGSAQAATSVICYDPATGNVEIQVNEQMISYVLESSTNAFIGANHTLTNVSLEEVAPGFFFKTGISASTNGQIFEASSLDRINGVSSFPLVGSGGPEVISLGQILAPGLDAAGLAGAIDAVAQYNVAQGQPAKQFDLKVVPEPSSLALIGLGGLLIARRRRG